jgi:hypothetical protein
MGSGLDSGIGSGSNAVMGGGGGTGTYGGRGVAAWRAAPFPSPAFGAPPG